MAPLNLKGIVCRFSWTFAITLVKDVEAPPKILESKVSYRWGFPLHLTIHKVNQTISLQHPDQLTEIFTFLYCEAMTVPDWLCFLEDPQIGEMLTWPPASVMQLPQETVIMLLRPSRGTYIH